MDRLNVERPENVMEMNQIQLNQMNDIENRLRKLERTMAEQQKQMKEQDRKIQRLSRMVESNRTKIDELRRIVASHEQQLLQQEDRLDSFVIHQIAPEDQNEEISRPQNSYITRRHRSNVRKSNTSWRAAPFKKRK